MFTSDILYDLTNSSWLRFCEIILDQDYGYLISLDPPKFNIVRSADDSSYITITGDSLPVISYNNYGTVNYAPLLFFLNDGISHPLYIPPNIELWVPHQSKIFNFFRDLNLTQ